MSIVYRTKAGETLDWICWQYYVKEINFGSAAMIIDPKLLAANDFVDMGFLLNSRSDETIRGAVEMVLEANPGLASYPLELPSGLAINLPDFTQTLIASDTVKLWD